ncbi:hypothetical protein [Parasegetibacter sp. NRK P23]|uniref:hypothetical protein n=1 Tax=Parasegetibacter sp. NRK P23 TaxID=2942999 RepID=UPI0020449B9B|nr:hypothetical protein [Parasegetibacter sp. NRK P23]MCM5530482.1 hypothetical protein [Parasegetibacter sp. NRK P23]
MKTIGINLPGSARIYVSFSKGSKKKQGNFMENNHAELEEKLDARFDVSAFQRKAHLGNFFAGPHCVFDPRLIK